MMELSSLLVKEKKITAEYNDPRMEGFIVDVSYLSREELQKIRQKCVNQKFNRKTRQPEDVVDNDLFLKLYVERIITGWKGLKLRYLLDLMPVELGAIDKESELPYSQENALLLMKNSTEFDTWITELVSDISAFNKNS